MSASIRSGWNTHCLNWNPECGKTKKVENLFCGLKDRLNVADHYMYTASKYVNNTEYWAMNLIFRIIYIFWSSVPIVGSNI